MGPKDKRLEGSLGSIGSLCCMTFIQQNTLDPPIGKLFDASLPCHFLLTFPLIALVGKIGGPCRDVLDEVQTPFLKSHPFPIHQKWP